MDLFTWMWVVATLLIPIFIYWRSDPKYKKMAQSVDEFPGPLKLPIIGTAYIVANIKRKDLWKMADKFSYMYWPIFRTWNGSIPEVHLMEADHIETILRSSVNINKGFIYKFLLPWLGTGLLTSAGQKWHSRRKLITPTFHFKILESFHEVFLEKSQILVQKLEKELGNDKGFDVSPYITHCALDIICETAMGTQINAQEGFNSNYVSAIYDIAELIVKRFLSPWLHLDFIYSLTKDGKRYKECLDILHSFTIKVIKERKQGLQQKSKTPEEHEVDDLGRKRRVAFLDLLLEASEGGAALSNEDIREEVDTFMFEGHDTTSASMCWTLLLLGNHPDVQDRVFEEQEAIFQGSDRQPTMQDISNMKYLDQVFKESLRLYPSVPMILRKITEDVKLGEKTIPVGAHVNLHIYHAHRNPKYFPDPEKFDPDNFLPERVQGRHPYAYIPFSAGSRNCIGQKFAQLEEKTVLSTIVRKFRIKALDKPSDITTMGELILRSAEGFLLVIERR